MKITSCTLFLVILISLALVTISCSKSNSNTTIVNTGTPLFPLAPGNNWNYKLKHYDTTTGLVLDSSNFTLSITGSMTANGATYYQFQNPVDTIVRVLANISNNTVGAIDSLSGISYYTYFVSGTGDSTQPASSWPVTVSSGGVSCQGTNKLYGYYADTTLVNNDGLVYDQAKKNDVVTYSCSGSKIFADVFFIKQGVGIVRLSHYVYDAAGNHLLQSAWVLESETLH